ncbi:unnamed protein product [Calypogeia fissa]
MTTRGTYSHWWGKTFEHSTSGSQGTAQSARARIQWKRAVLLNVTVAHLHESASMFHELVISCIQSSRD